MCIICYKPKGVDFPDMDTFKHCFTNNDDGCGFCYPLGDTTLTKDGYSITSGNKIAIYKGFMTFDDFKTTFNKVFPEGTGKDIPVIFHFRIRTHGKSDAGATQPIPVVKNKNMLRSTHCETSVAVVHNGIITDYCDNTSKLSDSQLFARDFLTVIKLYQDITAHKVELIRKTIGPSNKMVIMNSNGQIAMIGDFIQHKGCYYSNYGYKETLYSHYYPTYCHFSKQYKRKHYTYPDNDLGQYGIYDMYDI